MVSKLAIKIKPIGMIQLRQQIFNSFSLKQTLKFQTPSMSPTKNLQLLPSKSVKTNKTQHDIYFPKKYTTNFDKNSLTTNLKSGKNKFSAGRQNFLDVKRLPESISNIRETFSFNPTNFSKYETDQKVRSTRSKNQRLKELLNIAIDLQNLEKKSSTNDIRSKLSLPMKIYENKLSKSQNKIESETASSFGQKDDLFYGASEKQLKPYLRPTLQFSYQKARSLNMEKQMRKIGQQNQKRKSENDKQSQNQQHSFCKIKATIQSNKLKSKKQHFEFYTPQQQKTSFLRALGRTSDQKSKKEKIPKIKIHYSTRNQICQTKEKFIVKTCIDDFKMGKVLGKGRFGVVHLACHKATGSLFAIKVVKKQTIRVNNLIKQFILEVKLQSYLNHPFILKIFAIFDDHDSIYLVMEYLQQGCLFNYMKSFKNKKLSQKDAAQKVKYLAESIKYLQDRGIAHRDIKPQNIIINQGVCKLADFGWATFCDEERRRTYCGTCDYVAPQIVQGQEYDETVDLWCVGVMAYELVAGKAPFYHMSVKQTKNKIINVNITFPEDFSSELKSFILGLLQKDPINRMRIEDVLVHPFINSLNLCQ